ncbi:MAG TPA: response regulator [Gemmatimonadaceae bacterium]|nr:response regulator [Gemmatimonadaceae bacterium]
MPTVLYIDDDPRIRAVIRRLLEQYGVQVLTAESVAEAKQRVIQADPDGLFIDIWLGEETAFEVYSWLQQFHPLLAEHTAFVTGDLSRSASGTGGRSVQALGRPVLAKPFDIEEMVALAHAWARAD